MTLPTPFDSNTSLTRETRPQADLAASQASHAQADSLRGPGLGAELFPTESQASVSTDANSPSRPLIPTTALEGFSRAGLATSLRTVSESELKHWITEALRRVISTTTSLDDVKREQLLSSTRIEFNGIMRAHQDQDRLQAVHDAALAAVIAQREDTQQRMVASEAKDLSTISSLHYQLSETLARCESFARRVRDLEGNLEQSLADPASNSLELIELREELGERTAEVADAGARRDQAQRETRHVAGRLLREQERALDEKNVLIERISAGERSLAALELRRGNDGHRADVAEAQLAAATTQELSDASQAIDAYQRVEELRAHLAASIEAAEITHARLTDELALARIETAATHVQLSNALEAGGELKTATDRHVRETRETLAETGRERQLSADSLQAAQEDRNTAEQALGASGEALILMGRERDRLQESLVMADQGLKTVEDRVRVIATERDEAKRQARLAASRERHLASRVSPPPPVAVSQDVLTLQSALARARSVVTETQGHPREDIPGPMTAVKNGRWLSIWKDAKGQLKVARTVGDRWLTAGRTKDVQPVGEVEGEPTIISRVDGVLAGWRNSHGHACMAHLDSSGHLLGSVRDLGWSCAQPGMSRGGGDGRTFLVTTDKRGHVQLFDADGSAAIDLTAQLKAPPADGRAAAWHWPLEGSRHIVYRDREGSLHTYAEVKGRWTHANLTHLTQAPVTASDPIGYAPADQAHVLYVGTDGHIHELCFDLENWRHHDLTQIAAAPASAGRPSGAYVSGYHCIVYRGLDGQAHLLRQRRDWRHYPVLGLGTVSDDPQLGCSGSDGTICFHASDGIRRWARFNASISELSATMLPGCG